MLRLQCKTQSYAWGRCGSQSTVGHIARANNSGEETKDFEGTPFAEYWMGDHVNGPSQFTVTEESCAWLDEPMFVASHEGQTVCLSELLQVNEAKFLGNGYSAQFPHAGTSLAFLFKVLSVRTALSIQAHPDRAMAQLLHA